MRKIWTMDGTSYEESDLADMFDIVFDSELYEDDIDIDEVLTDNYGSIDVCGYTYTAAEILYALNEDAYYEYKNDVASERASDDRYDRSDEIESMEDGDAIDINGFTITCEYELDEDEVEDVDEEDVDSEEIERIKAELERREKEDREEKEEIFRAFFHILSGAAS